LLRCVARTHRKTVSDASDGFENVVVHRSGCHDAGIGSAAAPDSGSLRIVRIATRGRSSVGGARRESAVKIPGAKAWTSKPWLRWLPPPGSVSVAPKRGAGQPRATLTSSWEPSSQPRSPPDLVRSPRR
jgi:hypothetical protein